ncbi:MAG TPA: DUF4399 domain-containing protein [Acidimicrobiales bacterium]|nr:DUF4399 domain-containing protein [Acidimicrobiales bacterium]
MNRKNCRTVRVACSLLIVVLAAGACGRKAENAVGARTATTTANASGTAVEILTPDTGAVLKGNVAMLDLKITGMSVVAADGDTSGKSGHIHAFIDREPVAVGSAIPKEPGIVHSVDDPLLLTGLSAGKHSIVVVLGDGTHTRVGDAEDRITVTVAGPTVDATAPASVAAGAPVRIDFKATGMQIVKADGDTSGTTGHFHVFVDKPLPAVDAPIPKLDDGSVIHTAESFVEIPNLAAGEHHFFVVMGDGTHSPVDPMVADKVTVKVG